MSLDTGKKKSVMLTIEIDRDKSRVIQKYAGRLSWSQFEQILALADDFELFLYDTIEIEKYTPTKEDFDK